MSSNKVRTLAFLVTAFPPEVSGSSHFNWARAQWFAKQGYRVIVFAPDGQQSSDFLVSKFDKNADKNLLIERYSSKPWIPYKLTYVPTFLAARQISKKLATYQPDLIVMTDVERYFLLSAWHLPGRSFAQQHQVPYLAEYHTDVYNFSSTYPGWQWLRSFVRRSRLLSYLYHQLDRTICPSTAASKSCQEMGIQNTQVIPFFGTDISTYHPDRRDRAWLEPWLSPQEQPNKVLVFLGRLGFEKRVDLLIEAFAKLQRSQPNCSLLIVGDGPADVVGSLKRLAEPISNIHFTGFLLGETKANVLASCDVFCSPSPYETFGLTVVEAMASGVPVVTVDSGAVAEYLIDGVNGYLVPPNSVEGLTNQLEKVVLSDNTDLIQRALRDANKFSVEHGCQNLDDYYQHLLGMSQDSQTLTSLSRM
ncbi:glycosyltransferase [Myxacorys almedinensis]|uniref:Glycosyltransferase n=1 Tax=Myxacorys almedinensis A TaxID=2690445 RepID=A0A8J7ZCG9_9CYAN|nr:glycosyltransferase [Myxacorys almedinensis]NDJ19425.1 glycosyltransferase [Myxacorys almedinensis A]